MELQEEDVERIDIDPDGDLLLILKAPRGHGINSTEAEDSDTSTSQNNDDTILERNVEILVSSSALITASTVFKSMLRGPFKEGSDLAEARGHVYRLALPEDNAIATLLFCEMVHFKANIPTPNLELMEQLAAFHEKYQSTHILRFFGSMWINEHRRAQQLESSERQKCQQVCRMLVFAYVADMAQEFNELAWQLLLCNAGPIDSQTSLAQFLVNHPLMPNRIINALDERRLFMAEGYFNALYAPFNRQKWPHAGTGCNVGRHKMDDYICLLNEKNLLES
ncbi:hypothetical protein MCOR25_009143 [Pyricularia grisea]|nr:hypothetical protein MCOR25_009143 [Pyricularia grisea]